jgi:hypothetical protein
MSSSKSGNTIGMSSAESNPLEKYGFRTVEKVNNVEVNHCGLMKYMKSPGLQRIKGYNQKFRVQSKKKRIKNTKKRNQKWLTHPK